MKKKDWFVKAQEGFNKALQDCKTDYDVLIAQEQIVCRIRTMVHYRRMALMAAGVEPSRKSFV
jgi:hypothetical protein